jgi:SHS family lactate transporter-like MFS transporter
MSTALDVSANIPWWKEPSKEQWKAWIAAWLGWTLDAFDFTIFLLIMVPIAKEFDVPLTAVTVVFTITLWMRLVGATAAGWMADRMGRKTPLMISILWYSLCNFIAGFSPTFAFLFFFRALLGIGMGAEWPAGAALAMESWPARSRGFMSGVLQGSWGLGFALSALAYGFLFDLIGWRGLLWIGILPALQARLVVEYADGLLLDSQHFLRLLFDLGLVLGIPAEGTELDAADGGHAGVLGQHRRLCRQ